MESKCNFMTKLAPITIYHITGITRPYVCVCWFLRVLFFLLNSYLCCNDLLY